MRMRRIERIFWLKTIFITLIIITILGFLELNEKHQNRKLEARKGILDFDHQWCRQQGLRLNWRQYLGQCIDEMRWEQRHPHNSSQRTLPGRSYISKWELKPAGHFSRFWIQSVNLQGRLKTRGGDSWRVDVKQGPASIAPVIIDHQNGLYEVLMLFTEPGTYSVGITLEFTLCDGFRDPPDNWFRIGNVQGKYQEDGVLGYIRDDYINEPLGGKNKTRFDIDHMNPESRQGFFKYCRNYSKGLCESYGGIPSCKHLQKYSYLWDGYGQWIDGQWRPFFRGTYEIPNKTSLTKPGPQSGIMWILGDSINTRFHTLVNNRPLCKTIFKYCQTTYNWLYEVKNVDEAKTKFDQNDFNASIILKQYNDIVNNPKMMNKESAFIFTLGVHYVISLNFTTFKRLIDDIVRVLRPLKELAENEDILTWIWKPNAIWKTSTAMQREKIPMKYLHLDCIRFQTNQRVQLFNLYATSAMCNAGIPILDVYHLSASSTTGTLDAVHYPLGVFDAAADVLESFFHVKRNRV